MSTPASAIVFWLSARNAAAKKCIQSEANLINVGKVPGVDGTSALVVAFDRDVRIPGTLLTLGLDLGGGASGS